MNDLEGAAGMMTITRLETKQDEKELLNHVDLDNLPIFPTKNLILFPEVTIPVGLSRPFVKAIADEASAQNTIIGIVCQREEDIEIPTRKDLEKYGVFAKVLNVLTLPNGNQTAIVQAFKKFRIVGEGKESKGKSFPLTVRVKPVHEIMPTAKDNEFKATVHGIKELTLQMLEKSSDASNFELGMNLRNIEDPELIVNMVSTMFPFNHDMKMELLIFHRLRERASRLMVELGRQEQFLSLTEDIKQRARSNISEHQKSAFLHEQMSAIREELYGDDADDAKKFKERLNSKSIPDSAKEIIHKEIEKLDKLSVQGPDYSVQYNYLELLLSLPWNNFRTTNVQLQDAESILNADHYGLEKVKDRILEQLAVIINNPDVKSPILCLVGPPGVGKTSIARSIAKSLGRDYQRISLGGVHDEAEIRGHRRTYIGAMPGRIMDSLKRVETSNPVLVLDEIDKMGQDYKGDPSSALLEVLDPEQNNHFHDNYVDIDYDLSKVLFIATANTLSTLPQPLLDRMEIIEISGYAIEEKLEIAKRHIVNKVKRELSLDNLETDFTDEALETLIEEYTRESGVRQMEKKISSVLRKTLTKKLKGESIPQELTSQHIKDLLGVSHLGKEKYSENLPPGVVTGLAWTAAGGEILFIESTLIPGKGEKLTFTGNLGDVMKESATVAFQYVKSNASKLGIDSAVQTQNDLHIHIPEGAIPKDGPSAGITMVTGIVSALLDKKVKPGLAMTGEVTLKGRVLPVGGIKEKILAAKRAGITRIILSEQNRKDITEIPGDYLKGLEFIYVNNVEDVIAEAIEQ